MPVERRKRQPHYVSYKINFNNTRGSNTVTECGMHDDYVARTGFIYHRLSVIYMPLCLEPRHIYTRHHPILILFAFNNNLSISQSIVHLP